MNNKLICFNLDDLVLQDYGCGNWTPFKDEKCVKIMDGTSLSFDEAVKMCASEAAGSDVFMPTIRSPEEQAFFFDFLFNKKKVVDNVWLGAKFQDKKFSWQDGSPLSYANWTKGSPRNVPDTCIEIDSTPQTIGAWIDISCTKKNLVVCQKMQTWSIPVIQKKSCRNKKRTKGFNYRIKCGKDDNRKNKQ
jgi:hypothetical protein